MNIKPKNTIQLVFQLLVILLLFVEGVITYKSMEGVTFNYDGPANFFWKLGTIPEGRFFGILALLLMGLSLMVFIIQIVQKNNYSVAALLIPAQWLSVEIYFNNFSSQPFETGYYFMCERGPLSYLITLILAVLSVYTVVCFVIIKKKGIASDSSNYQENITNASNADELLKYKKLLNTGVITQEEYNKKKNDLLNQ